MEDLDRIYGVAHVYRPDKSGMNEGKPNKPVRIGKTSACLLTIKAQDSGKPAALWALHGGSAFVGQLREDGYIPSNPKYRLRLSDEESKMLFWNYYINEKYPERMTWNTGVYKYFDNMDGVIKGQAKRRP